MNCIFNLNDNYLGRGKFLIRKKNVSKTYEIHTFVYVIFQVTLPR